VSPGRLKQLILLQTCTIEEKYSLLSRKVQLSALMIEKSEATEAVFLMSLGQREVDLEGYTSTRKSHLLSNNKNMRHFDEIAKYETRYIDSKPISELITVIFRLKLSIQAIKNVTNTEQPHEIQ
jgi:hypothetical protein